MFRSSRSTCKPNADEQCFRFNKRELNDLERFLIVMEQIVGRRITYDGPTGKTGDIGSQSEGS
jgi:hypothetical protein